MYTLWVELPAALRTVFVTAKGSPVGPWPPIRDQPWLKTEDGKCYRKERKLAEICRLA